MSETAPTIVYPPELPVSQRRDDIMRAIRDHQVVIVAGATGSGKTTQLPKMLLELGYETIGHTQPRRIAARTIAERVAEELGQEVGGLVGYQVRFTDRVGPNTRIRLMTDGVLLAQIHRDRDLTKYNAIIIDEAHERSLTIDFLLGYLAQLLPRRPDLKVIITSATIDPESFARHFAATDGTPAPIIEVSGRTYPVEVRYRPLVAEVSEDDEGEPSEDRNYLDGITDALDELERESDGDVLVFLSGEAEIRDAEDAVRGHLARRGSTATEVLPLYGRLSAADQHKVFDRRTPGIRRRIVLATNVAETSLTVPGIRYVIDTGTARISRYSARSKIQRLPIEAISQASANQRSGRSGRTSEGIAIRLYSQEDFERRPEFTDPEILRTNLSAVILQMVSLGLGAIEDFPFIQKPDSRGVKDGLDLLRELHALDGIQITKVGRQLAQLPVDPRLGRMIVESGRHGVTREVIAIVAALTIQDPRERPLEKRAQADQQHARFVDPTSDFVTLLNLWNYLEDTQREISGNQFRRRVRAEYLNYLRVREWQDLYRQLARSAKQLGLTVGDRSTDAVGIHRSLLAGLLSHLGVRDLAKKDYAGARGTRFTIFPGSALAKKQPSSVMSAELVETSRLFARVNAAIDLAWAEPIAGDLAKRTYSEPHWEKKQGAAVAYERVTLYGVPIIVKRRVQFARIDRAYARDLFIRHALVQNEWDIHRTDKRITAFLRTNNALRARLAELEERTRRRDILLDDEAVVAFYDRRIPREVATQRDFEKWWKSARTEDPELLTMREEDLLEKTSDDDLGEGFPAEWKQGDQTLAVSYRFLPGADDDGVTIAVPLPLLAGLRSEGFDWQVPGLREELVTALIKALPKPIRKNVVPAGDWARRLLEPLAGETRPGSITEYLASEITAQTYVPTSPADFDWSRVPEHLIPSFAVTDDRGKVVERGRSLSTLQTALAPAARASVARVVDRATPAPTAAATPPPPRVERAGITTWDLGDLDRIRDSEHGGNRIRAYPALVDEGSSVAVRLMATPEDQTREHRAGVVRLLLLAVPSPTAYVQDHLSTPEKLILATSPYRTTAALFDDALVALIESLVDPSEIYTEQAFVAARDTVSAAVVDGLFDAIALVARILSAARDADKAIRDATSLALIAPLGDARSQLDALVHPDFISRAGLTRLRRYPVYLAGIVHRISKLAENVGRDRTWMHDVQRATALYVEAGGSLPLSADAPPRLVTVRWMLEEFRLSLFAQHLGTDGPVSIQRIAKALAAQ
ncbi:ATP-dependent helicase HrpA [Microbacteriaceae bacterium SG_E_30_P1]|uniref:ATP-dependent helicase HrpA n=1 Tax=Antiquaquibacter oligotrophicus TaxID=2880260 RepID=A0ABT6KKI6_9MICO|nr:ATP-dependent RNA helicase HrpA [Antiquaquibacter oligotrophicus]MDH6180236.1 ATP-dependent helicase HrpA [Antiquaquibacter oligotrophicus]UDF14017.1 ATP-dependent RNA helicase HrpA [Antiquaquibacter oligotrophicus]